MPTIKPGSKDTTKVIGAQVNTPRRARIKAKKKKDSSPTPSEPQVPQSTTNGDDTATRGRSRSRGRRLLDAAVARISLGRSRSKSGQRQTKRDIEISAPIVGTRVLSEVFGTGTMLTQPDTVEHSNKAELSDQENNELPCPVTSSTPFDPDERTRLLTTPQSWEAISDDGSLESNRNSRPDSNKHQFTFQSIPPESRHNSGTVPEQPTILSRLMSRDPNAQASCSVCSQLIASKDRYELIDQIMHRRCFKCALCGTGLANQSAVCHNGTWSCAEHFQFNVNSIDDLAL